MVQRKNEGGFEGDDYGTRAIGFGVRTAILLVDFQRNFADISSPLGQSEHIARAVDYSKLLLDVARPLGAPVTACSVGWSCEEEMGRWKVSTVYKDMAHKDPGLELDPRIAHPSNYTFVKTAPSMFFGTPLLTWLVRQSIDTVIIGGCTTSSCVRATINDAFSYGLRVIVVDECCGDHEETAHCANLHDVDRRYADVMTLDKVISALETVWQEAGNA